MKRIVVFLAVLLLCVAVVGATLADPQLPLPRVPISGDQDGSETPLILNSDLFDHLPDVRLFQVPGTGPVDVVFDFVFREATYNNEFGYFILDDLAGNINGIFPGEPNYLEQVLTRATVVFPAYSTAWTPDVTIQFQGGDHIAFFLVQAGTLTSLINNNPDNFLGLSPIMFFSFEQLNPDGTDHFIGFRNPTDNLTQFGFEDMTGGGDLDYDDIVYNIKTTLLPTPDVNRRDIVLIRGITSEGRCDGLNDWVPSYFESNEARALFSHISIAKYLNFSYAGGGSYSCPQSPDSPPAYDAFDTCDGVSKAAEELKAMIDQDATNKVVIFGHSMGGIVSAYMVSTNPDWAREKVSSVVTLDSPLKGVSELEASLSANWPLFWECTYDETDPDNSLSQLTQSSSVIQSLQDAATIVPFYNLDATKYPHDLVLYRDRVRLSSARSFHLVSACSSPFTLEPDCEPPTPVNDDHSEVANRRFDEDYKDKGMLFGCAAVNSYDCSFLTISPVSVSLSQENLQTTFTVLSDTQRIRYTSFFDQPVYMTIISADGTIYGPHGAGDVAGYTIEEMFELYEIVNPAPGDWHIDFTASGEEPTEIILGITVIDIQPSGLNRSPTAKAWIPSRNPIGEPVQFSGILSNDPDGRIILYEWDFENDGFVDFLSPAPDATYTYSGIYNGLATLRVTDDQGAQATSSFQVYVGDFIFMPVMTK